METQRLILREYKTEDFDSLYEIMSDVQTMQYYPAPFDEERTRGWILWNLENYKKYGFGLWAVVLKETGDFIGDCGITIQNIDGQLLPEIGYHINKKYWRRGFAKEAARAVRDWVFENTKYDEIYSYMKYSNVASYSTAMAIGMKKVKEYADPKNEISYAYSVTRGEWEKMNECGLYVRKATKDDVNHIFDFVQKAVARMDEQGIPQWDEIYPIVDDFADDATKNQLYVTEIDGKPAACFTLSQECDDAYADGKWTYTGPDFLVIHRLCVNPEFQNQGVGTKVCLEIEKIARDFGAKSIKLDCFTLNPYSQKMYNKLGYKSVGYADWRKGRFILMEKLL